MTQSTGNMPLVSQIKEIIQNHYHDLSKKLLNEKVRTEIIPILITLFFQSSTKDIEIGSRKSIFMSNEKILNQFQGNFVNKSEDSYKQSNKQNIEKIGIGKRSNNFPFFCLKTIEENIQDLPTDKLIKKTVAFCKIMAILQNLEMTRRNSREIFDVFREKNEKISKIKSFQQWINEKIKRDVIRCFYRNGIITKKQTDGCRRLLKFYAARVRNYLTDFLKKEDSTLKQNLHYSQECEKLKTTLLNRGVAILINKHKKLLQQSLARIKKYNYAQNPWRTAWVRNLVYRTPCNLQTSFWRLLNFCQNSAKVNEAENTDENVFQESQDKVEDEDSLQKIKKLRGEINKNILSVVGKAGNNEEIEAILFTKEQKAQILWKGLEYIHNLFSLQSMIEAFSALEQYSPHVQLIKQLVQSERQTLNQLIIEKYSQLQS